eukprot:361186-Chlamydomonas_euryale.AAC.4
MHQKRACTTVARRGGVECKGRCGRREEWQVCRRGAGNALHQRCLRRQPPTPLSTAIVAASHSRRLFRSFIVLYGQSWWLDADRNFDISTSPSWPQPA